VQQVFDVQDYAWLDCSHMVEQGNEKTDHIQVLLFYHHCCMQLCYLIANCIFAWQECLTENSIEFICSHHRCIAM